MYVRGKRFVAKITINQKKYTLGTFTTSKEAALAYDCAVRENLLAKSKLNYPNGLPKDDADYEELTNKRKRRLSSANTTGFRGVCKRGRRYGASVMIDRKQQ